MGNKNEQLIFKQAMLKAWSKMLYNNGYIDITQYNRMNTLITKLKK